jgi:hypothetical protein
MEREVGRESDLSHCNIIVSYDFDAMRQACRMQEVPATVKKLSCWGRRTWQAGWHGCCKVPYYE